MILPLIKLKRYDLFLWGLGPSFDTINLYLKSNDVNIKGIICPNKQETIHSDIPVITPNEINKQDVRRMFVIIIDPIFFYEDWPQSLAYRLGRWIYHAPRINEIVRRYKKQYIIKTLEKQGVQDYYFLGKVEFNEISLINSPKNYNRMNYYREHFNELKRTYDMLYDNVSKETMLEFIRTYLQSGLFRTEECDGRNKYFAGYGRGESKELLYTHKDDEVWVNCGSYIGDTILLYLSEGYNAKKIYAFEGAKDAYKSLCKNISCLPEELKAIIHPVNIFISEKTNWNVAIKEKVTLINADIEGNELELLHSMKRMIKTDRPVIALCAYHRSEDLIELPRFINETVNDYKFILRKYPSSIINAMRNSELVLYAIPQERLCVKKL